MTFANMSVFEKVRSSTKKVVDQAEFIKWDLNKLEKLASKLDLHYIKKFYKYEGDFYFKGKGEELLNYIITLNALNFGSGLSKEWKERRKYKDSSFKSVALALKKEIEQGNCLDSDFSENVNKEKIAKILEIDQQFELVRMFEKSLNELGEFVLSKFTSYSNLIRSINPENRAEGLVKLFIENLSCYRDIFIYNNFEVFFLKRAQILANDLYLAFEGKDYGDIRDVSNLTMFADNLVPHFFRIEGVLIYKKEILEKLEKEENIPSGSKEEIEIRSFAVQCVEKLKEILNKKDPFITSAMIDWYIWEIAHDKKYKSVPRHRTVTYFY